MAYIQSTINARSCCVVFLSFFFSFLFLLEVQLFVCSAFFCCCFFLCREIPENVLADNYWRFHTINYNSRKSNFYDSHAQREVTLAESENTTMMAAVYRWEWTDILTHVVCVCARVCVEAFWRGGCKYRCQSNDVQQSQGQKHLAGIWSFLITSVSLMNPPV